MNGELKPGMKAILTIVVALAMFVLTGCAGGGGPLLEQPTVYQSDVNQARQALATHRLEPSLNLPDAEMLPRLDRIWKATWPAILDTCGQVFSHGCEDSMNQMRLVLVPHESVNAYANPSNFTIGIHKGFMRSAGGDDEIAAVLAHEAAHLLFGHSHKKQTNATNAQLMTGALAIALGAATQNHGLLNSAGDISMRGWDVGYVAYSPAMEIEADQFAMYVLKRAGRRLTAGTDLIVRLHRGDVPTPVRRGDGWAGYLRTHPTDDYRLAAMQSMLDQLTRVGSSSNSPDDSLVSRLINGYVPKFVTLEGECGTWSELYPQCNWWTGGEGARTTAPVHRNAHSPPLSGTTCGKVACNERERR